METRVYAILDRRVSLFNSVKTAWALGTMATEAQHKLVREAVILVTEKYGDNDGLLGKIADCIDSTAFYKFCASILSHLQPLSATREKNALSGISTMPHSKACYMS